MIITGFVLNRQSNLFLLFFIGSTSPFQCSPSSSPFLFPLRKNPPNREQPYKDSFDSPPAKEYPPRSHSPVVMGQNKPQKSFERLPANPEEERKLAQLKSELEHVNSIIQAEDEKLKKLAWEFEEKNNDETSEFEKEARKIRENIRAWELKQWKLTERIEKGEPISLAPFFLSYRQFSPFLFHSFLSP